MRVAMLAPFALHPKGTTRWRVMPLARALAAQGHQVRVVIPPYDWPGHSGRSWRDGGVDVVNLALPARRPAGLDHLALAASMLLAALAWRPDVVHCFKPKGYGGLAAWMLAMRPGSAPLVVDADDWESGWNGPGRYPFWWRRVFAWQERWGLERAGAVTAASRWLQGYAAALRGDSGEVFFLPNGAEVATSRSQSAVSPESRCASGGNRPSQDRVLLYTRFVEHTPAHVWHVWQRILDREPGAVLLVAGRGEHGEEAGLASLARSGGAGRSLRLLGWLPTASRPGLFSGVDAAVLPVASTPRNRAKSPMRLVDLLAAGVPVAASAVGEYAGYVEHGVSGLLAPSGDDGGLADLVVRLLRDPCLGRRLGLAAAERIRTQYGWPRLAQAVLAAYEAVLATNRSAHE